MKAERTSSRRAPVHAHWWWAAALAGACAVGAVWRWGGERPGAAGDAGAGGSAVGLTRALDPRPGAVEGLEGKPQFVSTTTRVSATSKEWIGGALVSGDYELLLAEIHRAALLPVLPPPATQFPAWDRLILKRTSLPTAAAGAPADNWTDSRAQKGPGGGNLERGPPPDISALKAFQDPLAWVLARDPTTARLTPEQWEAAFAPGSTAGASWIHSRKISSTEALNPPRDMT
jgi:hypothetical protein